MTGTSDTPANEPQLEPRAERGVVIVTFDAAQILDVTGPLEVFSSATRFLPAVRYRTQVVTTRVDRSAQVAGWSSPHPRSSTSPAPSTP